MRGTIESGLKIGEVYKNGIFGISGEITNKGNIDWSLSEEMEVALRSEIKPGKAYILCQLENGKKEKYEVEIEKVYVSYGIACRDNEKIMKFVEDISVDEVAVERLVKLFNRLKLDPVQLEEAIEDALS